MNKDLTHLEGLDFDHGVVDCYSILRTIYKQYANIDLRNYARPNDWWINGKSLYTDNFTKEGFYILDDPKEYNFLDVFLIALPDSRIQSNEPIPPNHCAIYIGDGNIIHHRYGKGTKRYTSYNRSAYLCADYGCVY